MGYILKGLFYSAFAMVVCMMPFVMSVTVMVYVRVTVMSCSMLVVYMMMMNHSI